MNKLTTHKSKILKLTNVLHYRYLFQDEDFDFNIAMEQMQSYIRTKGAQQVGPLIQYTKAELSEAGELSMEMMFMLQCNHYIHSVEPPYSMESVLRVPNCMYCRYEGPEDKLKFAYDKIHLEAFEEDIALQDCSYTVFVDADEDEGTIVADVFIPRMEE